MMQRSGAPGARYLRLPPPKGGDGLAINRLSRDALGRVDAVAFDCDGVLVDARKSYDETIRVVVERMVEGAAGVRLRLGKVMPRLIATVRRTGGFNNDWDTSYALTLFAVAALGLRREGLRADASTVTKALAEITARFGSAPRGSGREAVDSFLESEFAPQRESLDETREFLGYPRVPPDGRMTTVFDELYFGPSLFEKIHGVRASSPRKRGLIELEKTLVSRSMLESLEKMLGVGRLAMVTGRPFIGTERSLGKGLMCFFNKEASIFIGDADLDLSLRAEYDRYRKPSPEALLRAREKLSSETLLYVGDSAEDLMMVQGARRRGIGGILFAGVYQTSALKADQASFFEREGSDVVARTVNQIPSGLLLAPRSKGGR